MKPVSGSILDALLENKSSPTFLKTPHEPNLYPDDQESKEDEREIESKMKRRTCRLREDSSSPPRDPPGIGGDGDEV